MNFGWELSANAVTAASILLAGRNSLHTWWTGIVGCGLFAVVFAGSQLYADVVLQVFFIVASAVGWWQWIHGEGGAERPVTHARATTLAWILPLGVVATAAYGAVLRAFTDAYAPFIDSAVLVFSVVAQLLMVQRTVESWLFWLLVNSIAVPLYASRGLYLTSALFAAYWVNALVSMRYWRQLCRGDVVPSPAVTPGI